MIEMVEVSLICHPRLVLCGVLLRYCLHPSTLRIQIEGGVSGVSLTCRSQRLAGFTKPRRKTRGASRWGVWDRGVVVKGTQTEGCVTDGF